MHTNLGRIAGRRHRPDREVAATGERDGSPRERERVLHYYSRQADETRGGGRGLLMLPVTRTVCEQLLLLLRV